MFSRFNNTETRGLSCGDRKIMWAVQEHVEKPKLTKQERKFCELLEGKDVWFATDKTDNMPYIYKEEPERHTSVWHGNTAPTSKFRQFCDAKFSFIKWEDKPWHINDLLALEVDD